MFIRSIVAFLCISSIAMPAASAATPNVTSPAVRAGIAAAVARDRALYGGKTPIPGVFVAVWDKAGHSYVHGFGYADVSEKRPFSIRDHFRIGSNTKTFIVAVILQLVDEGKLKLDDPVSMFNLGVKVPNADHITIRELCNMRSGIFEAYQTPQIEAYVPGRDKTPSTRQIIRWALAQKPYFAPDKGYHYSNTGYLLLGLIIEAVTHHTPAYEIETRLLKPLGLAQTSVPSTQMMPEPYAHGYALDAKGNWEDVSRPLIPVQVMGPAGDMISTVNDVHRWIVDYVTGKVSRAATYRALMDCHPTAKGTSLRFGLGLACDGDWFGYTGGLPGYNTANYYNVKSGLFILAWVDAQIGTPAPGAANALIRDIAKVVSPGDVPFKGSQKGI